jgi:serine/threonine protein kinase
MKFKFQDFIVELNLNSNISFHKGRFGITYFTTLPNGKKIVIKQYKPQKNDNQFERIRFIRQAEIMRFLYPELEPVIIQNNEDLFFCYNYIEGTQITFPLKKNIKNNKEKILIATLKELKRLHEIKFLHTDLKPSNILIQNEKIYLLDFGSCIKLNETLPKYYIIPFTMIYAPPEMILNQYELCNESSDIYMWGMVAYHILTGIKPFDHCNPVQLMHIQLNSKPTYHYIKDPKWQKIIIKATEKSIFPKPPSYYDNKTIQNILMSGIKRRYSNVDDVLIELA